MKSKATLHSGWQFRKAGTSDWHDARVPGNVFLDLMAAGLIEDPFWRENEKDVQWVGYEDWEYRTLFRCPDELAAEQHIDLVFEGLDTLTLVHLNSKGIAETNNMFRTWRLSVKDKLRDGDNELHILFRSPIRTVLPQMAAADCEYPAICDAGEKTSPFVRKAPYHFGWDWGPRLAGCGIWKPVRLEGWSGARIESLQVLTRELTAASARVIVAVEIEADTLMDAELTVRVAGAAATRMLRLAWGVQTAEIELEIADPQRWFPNGYGEQPLYTLSARLEKEGELLDQKETRFGLRMLEVRRTPDQDGAEFTFVVNGIDVFAKGGNWIPADVFPTRVSAEHYRHLLQACRDARMNMLRVWGGGIYEDDAFYDLCDELGLLVWQDFMFSCSLYPADGPFLENVRYEAVDQIKRLRNHPCLALWCGNNEMEWGREAFGWGKSCPQKVWRQYDDLFHNVLPNVCSVYDPTRLYWPSSPSSGGMDTDADSQRFGDVHYWDVWHKGEPFERYLEQTPRFVSEYGFQSFPLIETVRRFAEPADFDIESPTMRAHQKHPNGNRLIRGYMQRYYPEAKDFESFLYLSQILQAEGIRLGAEHFRRLRPRCMGSLYWQINDCWPVASWSSIDYYGNLKALHFAAARFYAPLLVLPLLRGDVVEVHLVSDLQQPIEDVMALELIDFEGKTFWHDELKVKVPPNSSGLYAALPTTVLGRFDPTYALLLCRLRGESAEAVLYFASEKAQRLPHARPQLAVEKSGAGFGITLSSPVLLRGVYLAAPQATGRFSDNFIDLLPNRPRRIEFYGGESMSENDFAAQLTAHSLSDAFAEDRP